MDKNSEVDKYIERAKWKEVVIALRDVISNSKLTEEIKWGKPCYVNTGKNIVIIQEFKEYCALMFFKGVLLADEDNVLVSSSENMQAARQMRFTTKDDVIVKKKIITSYIEEAIKIEKSDVKIDFKKTTEFEIPEELKVIFEKTPDLKTAFYKLTPGRQRGYLLYFAAPKQSKTRVSRIEKYIPVILDGKGLRD